MEQPNPLWQAHLDRLRRLNGMTPPAGKKRKRPLSSGDREPAWALHGELTANPPGRLGRRLLPEIEAYLEFFAIARESV